MEKGETIKEHSISWCGEFVAGLVCDGPQGQLHARAE